MCEMCERRLNRRAVGGMLAGAASLAALRITPVRAAASGIEALVLCCTDYGQATRVTKYLDGMRMANKYDLIALPGASLSLNNPALANERAAFYDELRISMGEHGVNKVMVIDHRDCHAYIGIAKAPSAMSIAQSNALHIRQMKAAKDYLSKREPKLAVEFYIMEASGKATKLDV